jgi:UDP-glucose 4-epimerase
MTVEHLRSGQGNLTCNVGYGRGHSVLEVIKAVREVSGANFPVEKCGRRAGDLAVSIASNEKLRTVLRWSPLFDDLNTIVDQALKWERNLILNRPS